jgi:hypothetical protein
LNAKQICSLPLPLKENMGEVLVADETRLGCIYSNPMPVAVATFLWGRHCSWQSQGLTENEVNWNCNHSEYLTQLQIPKSQHHLFTFKSFGLNTTLNGGSWFRSWSCGSAAAQYDSTESNSLARNHMKPRNAVVYKLQSTQS